MNCSVCNRNNAVTLSICPSCGAMLNDSVREELVGKISATGRLNNSELKGNTMPQNILKRPTELTQTPKPETSAPKTSATSEISAKTTSPTLVEFHNKNATVPEWRLQLQNVVRQRQERGSTTETVLETAAPVQLITSGANALKAEIVPQPKIPPHKNPTLNSALERIQNSRRQFLEVEEEKQEIAPTAVPAKANKNFPFYIAGKTSDADYKPAEINPPVNNFAKPKLASSFQTTKEKLDTNKLPPLPLPAPLTTSFESRPMVSEELKQPVGEIVGTKTVKVETKIELTETVETVEEIEEFDDRAPFANRFNAGLFDLIIGSFASLFLLSPFLLWGGNWLSAAGIFAFVVTCSVVMFTYMTTAIGFYGRTFGMKLFSLEIVDIETEDFPTFHQAAVNSAVYLLSLALGGIGFLSLLFNEDKRAVHDLVSGTIMVKE